MKVNSFQELDKLNIRPASNGSEFVVTRGDIYMVYSNIPKNGYDLPPVGHEQQADRPAVIVSNNSGNRFSGNVEVVFITTASKTELPTHCTIQTPSVYGTVLCESVQTIDKRRLGDFKCHLSQKDMNRIDACICVSLAIQPKSEEKVIEKIIEKPVENTLIHKNQETLTKLQAYVKEVLRLGISLDQLLTVKETVESEAIAFAHSSIELPEELQAKMKETAIKEILNNIEEIESKILNKISTYDDTNESKILFRDKLSEEIMAEEPATEAALTNEEQQKPIRYSTKKTSPEVQEQIQKLLNEGMLVADVAEKTGVSLSTAYRINRKRKAE